MRTEALKWFRSLSEAEFEKIVREWKQSTSHFAKEWPTWMISRSTSIIELIFKEKIKK